MLGRLVIIVAALTMMLGQTAEADLVKVASLDPGSRLADGSSTRVLYGVASAGPLKLLHVDDMTTETLPLPAGTTEATGRLVPGGALYVARVSGAYQLKLWRDGISVSLGPVDSPRIAVAGDYAIWTHDGILSRLTVSTQQVDVVSTTARSNQGDVAANGDVVFAAPATGAAQVYRWRSGVTTQISHRPAGQSATEPQTDGVNVIYAVGDGVSFSASGIESDPFTTSRSGFAAAGGWLAFSRYGKQTPFEPERIWTRAPDGTVTEVLPTTLFPNFGYGTSLSALSPAGQALSSGRILAAPGVIPFDLVRQDLTDPHWVDGHWFFTDGDASGVDLLRLDADTRFVGAPDQIRTSTSASFTTASTALSGTLACTLDGAPLASCPVSTQVTGLSEGQHTFTAAITDAATGEQDPTPATATWTVDSLPPAPFDLQGPENGAASRKAPELRWAPTTDSGTGLSGYQVEVDGVQTSQLTGLSYTPTGLNNGVHTWRVFAYDHAGLARVAGPRTFRIDTNVPTPPSQLSPASGSTLASARPVLKWRESADAESGLDHYVVTLDGVAHEVADPTFVPAGDLSDGEHAWSAVALDRAGNTSEAAASSFTVDTRPPVPALKATPNPVASGDPVTFDAGASAARVGGIARYEWDLDGNGSYELDTADVPTTSRSFPSTGLAPVGVRVTDAAGRSAVTAVTVDVRPAALPGLPGITIDEGRRFTNDPNVTITARWPSLASQMLVSNDGGFANATARPLESSFSWRLDESGAERLPRLVYVRFSGGLAGNETYTDDIILDQTKPYVVKAAGRPRLRRINVRLRARDATSGVVQMQLTQNRGKPGAWKPYRVKTSLKGNPAKPVFVRVRDAAGNRSAWRRVARR